MTTETPQDNVTTTQQNPAPTPTEAVNSGSSNSAKTFTQEHMSYETGKARKEARESAIADVLKKTGAATLEELIARNEEAQKRKESEMSEAQKAQVLADKAIKERDDAIAERDKERAERRQDRIESELRSALTTAKANNPKTVLSYVLVNHRDAMQALLTDDGKIDDKAMTALIETVQKEDPTLFGSGKGTVQATMIPSNANGRTLDPNRKDLEQAANQLRRDIKRF